MLVFSMRPDAILDIPGPSTHGSISMEEAKKTNEKGKK
jgi:hypothetical protein